MEHIIWESDIHFDNPTIRDDWTYGYKEMIGRDDEEIDINDVYDWAVETNNDYLKDEMYNLDIELRERVIAFAELNLWYGKHWGMRTVGTNVHDILKGGAPIAKWYSDGDNIRSVQEHHDGTNYILYRVLKDDDIYSMLFKEYSKAQDSGASQAEIDKIISDYTYSLAPYVHKVYGW